MTSNQKAVDEVGCFRLVLAPSAGVPCPPRFTFGTFPAAVASAYYRAAQLHGIGVYAADGLVWADGFIFDADGDFVVGGQIQIHRHAVEGLDAEREAGLLAATRERLAGTAAMILPAGNAYRIYGHWLVDILPKLAVLQAAGHDPKALWYPVPDAVPRFGLDLMALFGIPPDRIVKVAPGRAVVADTLLMPTSLHNGVRWSPLLADAVALFRAGIAGTGDGLPAYAGSARIYLARKGGNRLLTNRQAIESMAKAAGFTIVHPETLTLAAQIAMFSAAREIVGEYGSAFHTAMFSQPGTVVCGLRGGQFHPAFIQSGMGDVLGQPTGYVFGEARGDPARFAYEVASDVFADCLRIIFDRRAGLAARATLQPAPPATAVVAAAAEQRPASRLPGWWPFRSKTPGGPRPNPREAAAPPAPGPAPALTLTGHLQDVGDADADQEGWLGAADSGLAIEGVQISPVAGMPRGFGYRALLGDGSLSDPVSAGQFCGTRGRGTPIFGLVLLADPGLAASFSLQAEGRFRDGTCAAPVGPGVLLQSATPSPLTALRVVATPRASE